MWKTFTLYIKSLGILGWILMALNLFTALGAIEFYTEISVLQNFPVYGWFIFLIIGMLLAPFFAFHKLRKQRDDAKILLKRKIEEVERTIPRITVIPRVLNERAILEVHNIGKEAKFSAKGRILQADIDPELYTMYWESNKDNTCHIDSRGTASILISGISPITDETRNLFKSGLMLYKMGTSGEQVFGARSLEKRLNFLQAYGINVPEDKKYRYVDKCIVEVEITSSPPLVEPFVARCYELIVEHKEYWDRLMINIAQ